ncbi:hypothetical protein TIFTF001_013225 [Ficus carica]|uniref:Cupin type-1 domain-containing protein n=1 Tax=Ficus carica TaxID=3494 RepID=A0AA88D714_FICCA|nr:hypothetical protein TIFTF001_013225 [Ficus carica]
MSKNTRGGSLQVVLGSGDTEFGYQLKREGSSVAGIVLPESEEKVVAIKKGDAIALPFGFVTWWYNKEETELVVLFLDDTSKAHKAVKLKEGFYLSEPKKEHRGGLALNCEEAPLDVDIKDQEPSLAEASKSSVSMAKRVLETTVKGGNLFIVPRFYVVSKIAELGMVLYHHYSKPNIHTFGWKDFSVEGFISGGA